MPNNEFAVCLVVPVLNGERTLAEALDSVVAQTIFPRVRTIVVDNGSTDRTAQIAGEYVARFENIELISHLDGGCGGARNAGLTLVNEPYVAFLDADDLLTPISIERRLEAMELTGADLVVSAVEVFPTVKPYTPAQLFAEDRVIDDVAEFPELIDTVNATNKLFRREFFDSADNRFHEDAHFEDVQSAVAAVLTARRVAVVSDICYRYRKDPALTTIMTEAFVLPSNFWDILQHNAIVQDRFAGNRATDDVLTRYLVRTIREFFVRAPGVLDPDDLRSFFDEARRVYGGFSPDALAEYLLRASWAVTFYALLADDFELFADQDAHRRGVETIGGRPFLALDRPVRPDLQPILRLRPLAAADGGAVSLTVESMARSRRGRVELRGSVEAINQVHPYVPPVGFGFALEIGDTSVRFPISLGAAHGPRAVSWTAQLDPGEIPAGRHRLRLSSAGWVADRRAQVAVPEPLAAAGVDVAPNKTRSGSYLTVTAPEKRGLRQVAGRIRR